MLRLSDKRNKATLIKDHPAAWLLIQPRCAHYRDRHFQQVFSVTLIVSSGCQAEHKHGKLIEFNDWLAMTFTTPEDSILVSVAVDMHYQELKHF